MALGVAARVWDFALKPMTKLKSDLCAKPCAHSTHELTHMFRPHDQVDGDRKVYPALQRLWES